MRFTFKNKDFLLDGKKIVLRSGAIHYFRFPRAYWHDRLLKLKECGFNCVETYVPWNLHEKFEGAFNFTDGLDLGAFIDEAHSLGLLVIVRPGPYICAEWEAGGLPYWLNKYSDLRIRCSEKTYLDKLLRYLDKVSDILRPRLIDNGGSVIMVQIENEYGSYGSDKVYLRALKDFYNEKLPTALLFTSDGAGDYFITNGTLDDVLATVNFGSGAEKNIRYLESVRPNQPLMCMEFWCGWFDAWGQPHHTREASDKANEIKQFLDNDFSFNVYMFFGGTNFGFMNGANFDENNGVHTPQSTSYDYDAFLTEAGDRTEAYYKVRELISERDGVEPPPLTAKESEKRAYGKVKFDGVANLFDNLDAIGRKREGVCPFTMEEMDQPFGYIMYSAKPIWWGEFTLHGLHDRAIGYCDGKKMGVAHRGETEVIKIPQGSGEKVSFLVENMGRINYGRYMFDKKGVTAISAGAMQYHWETVSLPMEDLSALCFDPEVRILEDTPAFYRGSIEVDKPCDTFLRVDGFTKGFIMVNGVNIGRYWTEKGPQKTYYVPAPFLKEGANEIIVFDSDGAKELNAEFVDTPEL